MKRKISTTFFCINVVNCMRFLSALSTYNSKYEYNAKSG
jgi:hypothetical protein